MVGKALFIAGNWKNKLEDPTLVSAWASQFAQLLDSWPGKKENLKGVEIVVCAPFPFLPLLREHLEKHSLSIKLGAQDVSEFSGADKPVTGEVTAKMLAALGVSYVIIGHSERRTKRGETDEVLVRKVAQAKEAGLSVIFCVPDSKTAVAPGVEVVAYEPVWAIGSGTAEPPEAANKVISEIKAKTKVPRVIYGGSVVPDNVEGYLQQPAIDGVLPGGASLKAETFFALVAKGSSAS